MSLQEEINKLKEEKKAIQQEFVDANSPSSPNTPTNIYKQLNELIPEAIQQLSMLVTHAESESVRLTASKYIIEIARNPADPNNPDNALANLLTQLKKSPTTS